PAQSIGAYARALALELSTQGIAFGGLTRSLAGENAPAFPTQWIKGVAKDLVANKGRSLVVVGSRQPAAVHALACAINFALGNAGRTVTYAPLLDAAQLDPFEDIKALTADMAAGTVKTLVILGGNPVYD